MSVFYDLASLVLVPSGYKASKVYSQKPQTTDGQLAFTRASTATRVNVSGLVETVASGVPRLDYLNSTCPKLLLEPQRTNVLTYSEAFNVGWSAVASTITTDVTAAPNGASSADKITANTSSNIHFANKAISDTATPWTYSVFAKAAGYDRFIMWTAATNFVGFNLTSGVVESTLGTGITAASIQNYGNGWYRCSITSTSISSGTSVAFAVFNAAYTNGNTNPIFTGNETDGVFIWGAQFEAGAYPTSYISTESGLAVTRLADAASKTGISSLIGQTEGTVYIDFVQKAVGASVVQIQLNDGSNSNRVQIEVNSSGNGVMYVFSGGGLTGQISLGAFTVNTRYKLAMVYKVNDFAVYKNGALIGADTSGAVPVSMSRIDFGAEVGTVYTGYELSQALVFKTRLTNAQLAELTSL